MTRSSLAMVAVTLAFLSPGAARAADAMKFADQLGSLLGSEKACDLHFDTGAIRGFIEKNVRADDLEFNRWLNYQMDVTASGAKKMGATQLSAHCFQAKRSAEALGLLAK
jgi:hypothetical protein